MDFQNIIIKYDKIYIYEKNRDIKVCNYGIEIENNIIILCIYEKIIKYFNYFNTKNKFDNNCIFNLSEYINELEKYLKTYDSNKISNLIDICDFLQSTDLINNFIYNFFTDNIKYIYDISEDIVLKNNILYELILENIIRNIYIKIKIKGKIYKQDKDNKNLYVFSGYEETPEWIYYLIKIMINWMGYLNMKSKNKLRALLNESIIYVKKLDYNISIIQIRNIINNNDKICDIIPLNVLY